MRRTTNPFVPSNACGGLSDCASACAQARNAVAAAIQSTHGRVGLYDDWDWCVFEVVGDKTEQRAVVFKTDGQVVSDCEVS